MTIEKTSEEAYHCSHCASLGEVTFSCFQRQQEFVKVKVWVRNLPEGISESGVKNLFIAIGKPLSISFSPGSRTALVEFACLSQKTSQMSELCNRIYGLGPSVPISSSEAELAVRDLHSKPPYYLKVTLATRKHQNECGPNKCESQSGEVWDFSQKEIPKKAVEFEEKNDDKRNSKTIEVVKQLRNTIKNIHYDPSIRMRQRKLDFKTNVECISRGRGYYYMGKRDNYVGGLQKFESTVENSRASQEMRFSCENCDALTTKICGNCSAPYCSKVCLRNSSIDHRAGCADEGEAKDISFQTNHSDADCGQLSQVSQLEVPLLVSGCTVVMSTYLTMQTVYVRRTDESWEEKFSRLCNDVAAEAFKGGKLDDTPKAGDLVIARYHEDLCYYRAQVVSNEGGKINLVFIDFGNTQGTEVEDLKPLPCRLWSVPGLAVKVHLKGVSEDSSLGSVRYFNTLTADRVPLILDFDERTSEVVLTEKESKAVVNKTVETLALPSWKKDESVLSKLSEVYYMNSVERQKLEVGSTCNLIVSHFSEKEFLEWEVFWVTNPETDDFFHANSQMYLRIREYCEFLKDDSYLPRENELCLAREGGEWHRCRNLKSHKTTCFLFFLDDGHSSYIDTSDIRKMIADFTEAPSQAIGCILPNDPRLKTNEELKSKVVKYLKEAVGRTLESVRVLRLVGDAYCLSVPEIRSLLESGAPSLEKNGNGK